jgi:hypothetical protein
MWWWIPYVKDYVYNNYYIHPCLEDIKSSLTKINDLIINDDDHENRIRQDLAEKFDRENIKLFIGTERSYVVDKNIMNLYVTQSFVPEELMFIALSLYTNMITKEIGHGQEWVDNFETVLSLADYLEIKYKSVEY